MRLKKKNTHISIFPGFWLWKTPCQANLEPWSPKSNLMAWFYLRDIKIVDHFQSWPE